MHQSSPEPTIADLALCGPTLPHLTEAVLVAEACRRAALALHRTPTRILAGKDADGRPLRDQHQHAHFVPDCRGQDPSRITHLLVYAPGGLAPSAVAALARIQYLPRVASDNRTGEPGPVEVALRALGQPSDLGASVLCRRSRVFTSRTPFILPRHRKAGDEPEEQLHRELRQRGFPSPVLIERVPGPALLSAGTGGTVLWSGFRRQRRNDRVTTGTFGFRVEFSEPVLGPLLLGYGCHYGLGQFVA